MTRTLLSCNQCGAEFEYVAEKLLSGREQCPECGSTDLDVMEPDDLSQDLEALRRLPK